MDPLQYQIGRRFHPGCVPVDPSRFLGPKYPLSTYFHSDTTGVAEPLSFRQVGFAPSEFLGQELVLRDVYGAANVLFQALVFYNGSTDPTNVPDLTIGAHDALGGIEGRSVRQDSLDQVRHGLAILWVENI